MIKIVFIGGVVMYGNGTSITGLTQSLVEAREKGVYLHLDGDGTHGAINPDHVLAILPVETKLENIK